MKISTFFDLRLYGSSIFEAITLDMLLDAVSDGLPKEQSAFIDGKINPFEVQRKVDKLLKDGFISELGSCFIITSDGALHISKGGYVADVKKTKRAVISFWLSIIAVGISLFSFFFSLFHKRI